jgi:hypothetical protein
MNNPDWVPFGRIPVDGMDKNRSADFRLIFDWLNEQVKLLSKTKSKRFEYYCNRCDYLCIFTHFKEFFNGLTPENFEEDPALASRVLDVGRSMLWIFFPRNISKEDYERKIRGDGIPNPVVHELLGMWNHYPAEQIFDLEQNFKINFRDMLEGVGYRFDDESLEILRSNPNMMPFLYQHCDVCGVRISEEVNPDTTRKCDACKGTSLTVPSPSSAPSSDSVSLTRGFELCKDTSLTASGPSSAPTSDSISLATQIESCKISVGDRAIEIAQLLMSDGVFNLSDLRRLKHLNEQEFSSTIAKLKLNTLQVQRLLDAISSL